MRIQFSLVWEPYGKRLAAIAMKHGLKGPEQAARIVLMAALVDMDDDVIETAKRNYERGR